MADLVAQARADAAELRRWGDSLHVALHLDALADALEAAQKDVARMDTAIYEYVDARRHGSEGQRNIAWLGLLAAARIAPIGYVGLNEDPKLPLACEQCDQTRVSVRYRPERDVPLCDKCAAAPDVLPEEKP